VISRPSSNVAIGIALIAASVLVSVLSYLQSDAAGTYDVADMVPQVEAPAPELLSVVVARQPIGRGQRVGAELLSELRVEPPLPPGAMRDPAGIVGAVALYDIPQGQIVTEGSLVLDKGARPGLSILVPDGLRAVALRVNDEVSVGNFVRAGDRVDIQLVLPSDRVARVEGQDIRRGDHTVSSVLLQNVLILSTGETLAAVEGHKAAPMKNITVAVSPEDALLLAIAKDAGTFSLALRNPADKAVISASRMHLDDLLAPFRPPEIAALPALESKPAAPEPKSRKRTVTIIRGTSSTSKTFTSEDES